MSSNLKWHWCCRSKQIRWARKANLRLEEPPQHKPSQVAGRFSVSQTHPPTTCLFFFSCTEVRPQSSQSQVHQRSSCPVLVTTTVRSQVFPPAGYLTKRPSHEQSTYNAHALPRKQPKGRRSDPCFCPKPQQSHGQIITAFLLSPEALGRVSFPKPASRINILQGHVYAIHQLCLRSNSRLVTVAPWVFFSKGQEARIFFP